MSGTEATAGDGGGKEVEPQTESSDATEHLKMKLAKINNELQDTMKICENYKEDKQTADRAKNELEASKRKITDLERRLADSESNCKRYRNERNNLRRDVARLIDDRKQMISYEEDVQKLQRDIEMQKNKYNCDIREWKNKLSDAENRYEEIIKEEKLKVESSEKEVQKLRNELGTNNTEHGTDKETVNTTAAEPGETNEDAKHLSGDTDQPGELEATGGIHATGQMDTIKRGYTGINDNDSKFDENTDHNLDTNNVLDPVNDITDNETQYRPDQEHYDDYDGDDSSRYKIKRHKVIKEYRTIETRENDDDPDENSKGPKEDSNENSNEKPDAEVKEEADTKRPSWEKEVAVEEQTDPGGETQSELGLAERYQQLYDNQWKNTYEKLRHHFDSDLDTVTALLEILQDIMAFCKRKAHEQIEDMYRILTFSTDQKDKDISEKITKHLKECMKEVSSDAKTYLYEIYPSSFRKKQSLPADYDAKVEPFVKECFEICWLIVITEEPIELRPLTSDQDELDLDVYNPYTNTGQYLNYVVWPSLQFSKGGSVFAKGVAEGSDTRQDRRHEVLGVDTDADKDRSFKRSKGGNEITDQKHFDELDGKDAAGFSNRDDAERYTRRTKYSHHHEHEFAERDVTKQRNSLNVDERSERISEEQLYRRGREYNRSDDESGFFKRDNSVFNEKRDYEKSDVTIENTRADTSNRVHFSERDEMKSYRSNVDSRYERGYDSKNERREFDSYNRNSRREYDDTEEKLDVHEGHYYSPTDRLGAQPLHAFDVTDETRPSYPMSIIQTKAKGTTNVWKPSYGYERDPTPEEMRLYHRYIDNHDHTGARDVLGNATYLRCLRKDHTQHFYR